MKPLQRTEPGSYSVAPKTGANPEGKGANGFLLDWYRSEPRGVMAKPRRQLLAEFFTSMLVLYAKFKFRLVVGRPSFLYWIDNEWNRSLISPDEASAERREAYGASCTLQRDMTWTIIPSERLKERNSVSAAVGRFYDAFAETMDTDLTLEEILPFYVGKMPYYQRLYASALSRSMRAAVILGEQTSTSCREWHALLPDMKTGLLAHRS